MNKTIIVLPVHAWELRKSSTTTKCQVEFALGQRFILHEVKFFEPMLTLSRRRVRRIGKSMFSCKKNLT